MQSIKHKPALEIYHNNYIENGIRALSITYRTLFGIMDEKDFRRLASTYLLKYPKICFDWADYGEHLASYMFEIEALSEMPYLPELAEVDWCLMQIERAANKGFVAESFGLMQSIDMQLLKFDPAPGLQTMKVRFPIYEIYNLVHGAPNNNQSDNNANESLSVQNVNKLVNDAINKGTYRSIVLWREQHKGLFEYCTDDSFQAFNSMMQGNNIIDILSHFGDDQVAMSNWLQAQIQSKKIYAVQKLV